MSPVLTDRLFLPSPSPCAAGPTAAFARDGEGRPAGLAVTAIGAAGCRALFNPREDPGLFGMRHDGLTPSRLLPSSPETVSSLPAIRGAGRASAWTPLDDVPLVLAAQSGDPVAFDGLYRRHARVVHAVLLGRTTREDVEDLVQEVFLSAWRQLRTLRDPAAFGGWVTTIARHLRVDHVRRTRVHEPLDDQRLCAAAHDGPEALDADRALAAIRRLPEAYREPLLMRLVEGLTGPEIADRTGLTPGSVRVNLCRGMKLLRDALHPAPATRPDLP